MMILLAWLIGLMLPSDVEGDPTFEYTLTADSPMVHEDLGLVLLPGNILAQSTSMILQSVFLKLESPRPPAKMCNLDCAPKIKKIRKLLTPLDGCWIERMAVVQAGILEELSGLDLAECFTKCLLVSVCGAVTHDKGKRSCILRTGHFYRVNAIDETLTSVTAKMNCIFENHNTSRLELCGQGNDLFYSVLQSMEDQHHRLLDRYFNKYQDVKKAYNLNTSQIHSTRHKRGLGWSDFDFLSKIPILGHFYDVLKSPSENRKLKDHLNKLSDKFTQFVSLVSDEFETSRRYNQEVLEMVDAGFAQVYEDILGLKCDIASLASLTIFQQSLKIHSSKLDELFFASKHGRLQASLPQVLSLDDLKLIIAENPNFKDTLFKDHPEVLYRVGELYLLDATKNTKDSLFHFLLTTPKLVPDSLFRTYHPVQVPTTSSDSEDDLCFITNIPPTVIIQGEKLVAADITDCYEKEQVILCQQDFADSFSPQTEVIPCLNGNPEKCSLTPTSCEPRMTFTKAGALVFSKGTILGMPLGETSKLSILNVEGRFSYFFSWTMYKIIQSKHKVIYSPNNELVVKNLTWEMEQNFLDFRNLIKINSAELIANNVSKLKKELDNVTSIALKDFTPDYLGMRISRRTWTDITGTFSLVCTVFSTAALILFCCYKRVKQSNQIVKLVLDQLQTEKAVRTLERVTANTKTKEKDLEDDAQPQETEPLVTSERVTSSKKPAKTRQTSAPNEKKIRKRPKEQLKKPTKEVGRSSKEHIKKPTEELEPSSSESDSETTESSTEVTCDEKEEKVEVEVKPPEPEEKDPKTKSKKRKSAEKKTKITDAFGSQ